MPETSKTRAVRAVQMAMDLDARVARTLRVRAAQEDLTLQDYVRRLLGLDFKPAQRPRLSISLSDADYEILAARYGLAAGDRAAIKKAVITSLTDLTEP
ncbi:MAG: hypothetical protein ACFB6R_01705 [Alphaproteobacteria bacterium]